MCKSTNFLAGFIVININFPEKTGPAGVAATALSIDENVDLQEPETKMESSEVNVILC